MDLQHGDRHHLDVLDFVERPASLIDNDIVFRILILLYRDEEVARAISLVQSIAADYLAGLAHTSLKLKIASIDHVQRR